VKNIPPLAEGKSQKIIIPFPEEKLNRVKAERLARLRLYLRFSGKLDAEARRARLEALYQFFLGEREEVYPPWHKGALARLYFDGDRSYLYFDPFGTLCAGIKEGDKKTSLAARVIERYQLMKNEQPSTSAAK
jgi:hypothetical protein